MTETVRLVEVGPRDGLQNEPNPVPTAVKLELIRRLADAGLRCIEATAFVSPKWVPQMADQADVMAGLPARSDVAFPVLAPNLKGYEAAVAAGAKEVAIFGAASESFSQRNINCSIAESMARFAPVMAAAARDGVRVRGYVSCVVACPYEGAVAPAQAAAVAAELHAMGCYEVSLGDTIGAGTPASVLALLEATAARVPVAALAGHYHDTYGMAVANVAASYGFGLRVFDSSVAGLGGCPYAKGATGNVATEDLVYLLHGLGAATGVDEDALADTGAWISAQLGRANGSRAGRARLAKRPAATGA
ncbi:MAG: hydroxymethylglutaryl-CoA lyase [Burkholderiaceae bacterium]|nr:hydroxymethylglutaryl-CoA lyase [Burkholderiaceae bacterium]